MIWKGLQAIGALAFVVIVVLRFGSQFFPAHLAQLVSIFRSDAPSAAPSGPSRLSDTAVISVALEDSERKPDPGMNRLVEWRTLRVTINRPLEPREIEVLASEMRGECNQCYAVGLRFVLPDQPRRELDPEVADLHYAWRLFKGDGSVVANFFGVSPEQASSQVAALRLGSGEKLSGVWVDHHSAFGVVALIEHHGVIRYARLSDPDRRWEFGPPKNRDGDEFFVATQVLGPRGERFKADGNESDHLAIALRADGKLAEYDRIHEAAKPLILAEPFKQFAR